MQDCNCYQLCLEGKFARCPALKYGSLMRVAVFSWFPLIAVNSGLSWNILTPFQLLPSVVAFRPFCTDVVTPRTSCRPSNRDTRAHKTYIIIWDHMRIITSYAKCIYNNCTDTKYGFFQDCSRLKFNSHERFVLFGGDPDSLQATERWKYVGQGHGSYNEQSKLEYVGAGRKSESVRVVWKWSLSIWYIVMSWVIDLKDIVRYLHVDTRRWRRWHVNTVQREILDIAYPCWYSIPVYP